MRSVHIIYTGGTIGMMEHAASGRLSNVALDRLSRDVPELEKLDLELSASTFLEPIDSCDMTPKRWLQLAQRIEELYHEHDGFVVMHGTDTMAYTASALSFLLQGLQKPVILTGSQLPIGTLRTDGKENLITAVEIAGSCEGDEAIVQEVAVYFEYKLYRGNRCTKVSAAHFDAFASPNWPELAEAGVKIDYKHSALLPRRSDTFTVSENIDSRVVLIKLFPGIDPGLFPAFANGQTQAVVVETYGSGNVPSHQEFFNGLDALVQRGMPVVHVTQCLSGSVLEGRYGASAALEEMGVVGLHDMTTESAITKMMYLLGNGLGLDIIKEEMRRPLCGETTPFQLFVKRS